MILVFVFIFESSFSLPESLIIKSLNPASGHLAMMNGKKREVGGFLINIAETRTRALNVHPIV